LKGSLKPLEGSLKPLKEEKLGSGYSTKYQLTAGVPYLCGDLLRSALLYCGVTAVYIVTPQIICYIVVLKVLKLVLKVLKFVLW
jgi:hypothetical protein